MIRKINFHDIGDYLGREDKLKRIQELGSVAGITKANGWRTITPDQHFDWLRQRSNSFNELMEIGNKHNESDEAVFFLYSSGVKTQRDAWCYNYSRSGLKQNINRMLAFYAQEKARLQAAFPGHLFRDLDSRIDNFVNDDPSAISWSSALKKDLARGKQIDYDDRCMTRCLYRPFTKQWLYYSRDLNERVYRMPAVFPDTERENLAICVNGVGAQKEFSALMTKHLPDLHLMQTGQCFPLYRYDSIASAQKENEYQHGIFDDSESSRNVLKRRYAISKDAVSRFCLAYPGRSISEENIFYYIYGILHSTEYRERYADSLAKELPRVPLLKSASDFWAFASAGKALANLHLHYEAVEMYPAMVSTGTSQLEDVDYRVEKMRHGKQGKVKDFGVIHYNDRIAISGIPAIAYEYVVNGKSAIEWVMERQCVKVDKASGIVNDANDWALEAMRNPRYPLELLLRVITVSVETMKIVNGLPVLDI